VSPAGGATPTIPAPGFADPTRDAQRVFRAVLDALSRPTRAVEVAGPAQAPAVLGAALAGVLLTLLDEECTAWLSGRFAGDPELDAWLAFHTGVRRTAHAATADFVLVDAPALPPLQELAQGSDEAPHRSATVVLDVRGSTGASRWVATGPGIDGSAVLDAPWAGAAFPAQWRRNTEGFPRGVDLLLVATASVTGLPRTTRLQPSTRQEQER